MKKKLVGALTAVALTSTVLLSVGDAAGAAGPRGLVLGKVLNSGRPVSGATVTLTAWPNAAFLSQQGQTDTVPTLQVAAVTTATDGSYAMAPNLSGLSSMYKEPDGTVNLTEDTAYGANGQTFNLAAAALSTIAASNPMTAVAGAQPEVVSFDFGKNKVTSAVGSVPAHTSTAPNDSTATTSVDSSASPDGGGGAGVTAPHTSR